MEATKVNYLCIFSINGVPLYIAALTNNAAALLSCTATHVAQQRKGNRSHPPGLDDR